MLKPFHFWCQKVLPLVFDDSLSYYEVLCKLTRKVNEIISTVATDISDLKEWVETKIQELIDDIGETDIPKILFGKTILVVCDNMVNVDTWKPILEEKYGAIATVVNVGGYGYASANAGDTNVITAMLEDYKNNTYDYILLAIGQHDYISQKEIGVYRYGESPKDTVTNGISTVLQYLRDNFADSVCYVFTPLSNGTGIASIGAFSGGSAYDAISQKVYNFALQIVANYWGASVIEGSAAPNFSVWHDKLYMKWTTRQPAPNNCIPNEAYAETLADYIARGIITANTETPNITDTMILDHPEGESSNTMNFFINRHTNTVRVRIPHIITAQELENGYVDFTYQHDICQPLTDTYGNACIYQTTAGRYYNTYAAILKTQKVIRFLIPDGYNESVAFVYNFNLTYQNQLASQGL